MCWHKWTKWEVKTVMYLSTRLKNKDGNPMRIEGRTQSRQCLKCGWIEEYEV